MKQIFEFKKAVKYKNDNTTKNILAKHLEK